MSDRTTNREIENVKISEILSQDSHQPLGLPDSKWRFYQEWNRTLFLHWKVDRDLLRPFIPQSLELEQFEDRCWISFVAFSMENVRLRHLPSFPPVSNFHELNLRTYVRSEESSGVYFLSIEAAKRISTFLSKALSGFPYRFSRMKRKQNYFDSKNESQGESFEAAFELGGPHSDLDSLDSWLVERYFAFQEREGHLYRYQIHHLPWTLRKVKLESFEIDYPRFESLLNGPPDRSHYSDGVQMVAWDRALVV